MSDPIWPDGPALGGRAVVAIGVLPRVGGHYEPARLWWLKLDRDGSRVEDAAPLTVTDSPADRPEERLPALGRTPSGESVLSYLTHAAASESWEVRIAPIRLDPETGTPSVLTTDALVVAKGCAPLAPAFSADGRWLLVSRKNNGIEPTPQRIPIGDALRELGGSGRHVRTGTRTPPGA